MNTKNLQQIFANYIDHFEEMNDAAHDETFKWWAAYQFHDLMDKALQAPIEQFADLLDAIKGHRKEDRVVETIIDGQMRPFAGLVQLAKEYNAAAVQTLFQNLFADDGGDLNKREQKISIFLQGCEELRLAKFPNYYSYKQTARSVAGYLFLYDPEQYYMYKSKEAHRFADDIEFNGDWGSGDHLKLKEYYRMCDELVAEIKKCPALRATHNSRFLLKDRYTPPKLANDSSYHILAYDIIYCTCAYDLDRNITFKKISLPEKKLYQERLKKALEAQEEYLQAETRYSELESAIRHYDTLLVPETEVYHVTYGAGKITSRKGKDIIVDFANGSHNFQLDFFTTIANSLLKFNDSLDAKTKESYCTLLKNYSNLSASMERARSELKKYSDILE